MSLSWLCRWAKAGFGGAGPARRAAARRAGARPGVEWLEDRRLLTSANVGWTSLVASGQLVTYSGVGFRNLTVAGLAMVDMGDKYDDDPAHYKVSLDWGDGRTTTLAPQDLYEVGPDANTALYGPSWAVKGSHVYYLDAAHDGPDSSEVRDIVMHVTYDNPQFPIGAPKEDIDLGHAFVYWMRYRPAGDVSPAGQSRPGTEPVKDPDGSQPPGYVQVTSTPATVIAPGQFAAQTSGPVADQLLGWIFPRDNGKPALTASDYRVRINWGDDGGWDVGAVVRDPNLSDRLQVRGTKSHPYAVPGVYDVHAYVTGPDNTSLALPMAAAVVSPGPADQLRGAIQRVVDMVDNRLNSATNKYVTGQVVMGAGFAGAQTFIDGIFQDAQRSVGDFKPTDPLGRLGKAFLQFFLDYGHGFANARLQNWQLVGQLAWLGSQPLEVRALVMAKLGWELAKTGEQYLSNAIADPLGTGQALMGTLTHFLQGVVSRPGYALGSLLGFGKLPLGNLPSTGGILRGGVSKVESWTVRLREAFTVLNKAWDRQSLKLYLKNLLNLKNLEGVLGGKAVEKLVQKLLDRDLNAIAKEWKFPGGQFPVVDGVSRGGQFVSVAYSETADGYLRQKFQALFGIGSKAPSAATYKKMLAVLGVNQEQFILNAQLAVPDQLVGELQGWIRSNVLDPGWLAQGGWPSPGVYQTLLAKFGTPRGVADHLAGMIRGYSTL
jgi:hypothetical protein